MPQIGHLKLRYQGPLEFLAGKALQLSSDLEGIRTSLSAPSWEKILLPDVQKVFEQDKEESLSHKVTSSGVGGLRIVQRVNHHHTTQVNIRHRTCSGRRGNCLRVALNKTPCAHLLAADAAAGLTTRSTYVAETFPPYLVTSNILRLLDVTVNPCMSFNPPNTDDVPASSYVDLSLPMNEPLKQSQGRRKKDANRRKSNGELRQKQKRRKGDSEKTSTGN
jgi:hypothetical protein